jgi:hypothetical protein
MCVCVCAMSLIPMLLEWHKEERGEPLEAQGLANLTYTVRNSKMFSSKIKGKRQHPRLSSDIHTCVNDHTYMCIHHTQAHTHTHTRVLIKTSLFMLPGCALLLHVWCACFLVCFECHYLFLESTYSSSKTHSNVSCSWSHSRTPYLT